MADYIELLKMRRSIRDYEAKEVPLNTVKEIIRETCLAPSSGNGQPWRFIIINDREMIKRLSDESKRNLVADCGTGHPGLSNGRSTSIGGEEATGSQNSFLTS